MKLNLKSQFIRSLAMLASGSILAQLIVFITSPIMTRMYTATEIGEYTIVLTAVGIFGSVICGRYDMAIVSEEEEKNVFSIVVLSFVCTIVLSTLVSLFYALYYVIKGYLAVQILFSCVFIFLLLIINGISNILLSYNNRCREYKLMTSVNLIRSVVKEAIMVFVGLVSATSWILLLSEIMGTIFGVRRQARTLARRTEGFFLLKNIKKEEIVKVARKHKRQFCFSMPAMFANNFSYSSITLFISSLFGTAVVGYYSISYRLLGLPLNVISSNVSRIYLEETSRSYLENGTYRKIFIRTSGILFIIAIPMTVAMMLLAPAFCAFFYGEDYYIAGIYLRYLAVMYGIRFVVSPLSIGMQVSKRQDSELLFQVLFVVFSVAAFVLARMLLLSVEHYLLLLGGLYSIIYIVLYAFLYKITNRQQEEIKND